MYVKLMSGEDLPDTDNNKAFTIVECRVAKFHKGEGLGWVEIDGEMIALTGNTYILNNSGKTIDSHWNK